MMGVGLAEGATGEMAGALAAGAELCAPSEDPPPPVRELEPEVEAAVRAVAVRMPAADIAVEGVPEGCRLRGYEPGDGKPNFWEGKLPAGVRWASPGKQPRGDRRRNWGPGRRSSGEARLEVLSFLQRSKAAGAF